MINLFHKYHNEHSQVSVHLQTDWQVTYIACMPCFVCYFFMQGWYLYIATGRWFGLRIDILSAMFLAVVVVFSVLLSSSMHN